MTSVKILTPIFFLFFLTKVNAQDSDLMKSLESDSAKTVYTTATFKTTRLINGHSVEITKPGILDVRIDHRFSYFSGGAYEFFGLDHSNVRIGFDYGLCNHVMIGIGHTANDKTYDAFFKWKIVGQSSGAIRMPVTIDFVPTFAICTLRPDSPNVKYNFSDRVSLSNALIIGRKFSENLSLQIMPTFVIKDKILYTKKYDNCFAIGIGGRQKISKHTSFNIEYYYQLPSTQEPGSKNILAVGVDIETGGHVFQVHFTNAQSMIENTFIPGTTGNFFKGDIGMGFNLSRVFNVSKKSKGAW